MAEEYFNARARKLRIEWRADSRGLIADLSRLGNVGAMSLNARRMLENAQVHINNGRRYPLSVSESDLADAEIVVALSHNEHYEMVNRFADCHKKKVRFWDVEDIHLEQPKEAFAKLVIHVERLVSELMAQQGDSPDAHGAGDL